MSRRVTGVQPAVLKWARQSQGYTIEDVAARLRRRPEEIAAWETGEKSPTYVQLERLAYKVYKRPLAVFFLPKPPSEPSLKQEFRTLPEFEIDRLSADTRYQLRVARSLQISLQELTEGSNPAKRKIFKDVELSPASGDASIAATLREYLEIPFSTQTSWRSTERALRAWRDAVENVGVFVFKNSFKQRDISGFCLVDPDFPIIYLNNSTAKSRQIFTLFHELTHLLLHQSDIGKADDAYIEYLPPYERNIERFCNAVTAEFLIPSADFVRQIELVSVAREELIEDLAARYSVSRESILRRMLDMKLVSQEYYERKAAQWAQEAEESAGDGGNYFLTQAAYLGENYLSLVFAKYYKGEITAEQTADYLGVRTKSLEGLESVVLGKSHS